MPRHLPLALALPLLASCAASPTPNYDLRFGDAVRDSRVAQTLNQQPSANPVQGMDGKAAKEAAGRYVESFQKPPPVIPVINIGGAIGGGGGR